MTTKSVRIQLNGSVCDEGGAPTAQKLIDEESGEFRERQRRRSNASNTAGAIKSILKARRASVTNGVSSPVGAERRASLAKPNGERRGSSHSVLSGSSYSKCTRGSSYSKCTRGSSHEVVSGSSYSKCTRGSPHSMLSGSSYRIIRSMDHSVG